MDDLVKRLRSWHHLTQGDSLEALIITGMEAADRIAALEAKVAAADALVETAQWARNRLEIIADESWYGDGRDLKRSIIGVFADFDAALLVCGSSVPPTLAAYRGAGK